MYMPCKISSVSNSYSWDGGWRFFRTISSRILKVLPWLLKKTYMNQGREKNWGKWFSAARQHQPIRSPPSSSPHPFSLPISQIDKIPELFSSLLFPPPTHLPPRARSRGSAPRPPAPPRRREQAASVVAQRRLGSPGRARWAGTTRSTSPPPRRGRSPSSRRSSTPSTRCPPTLAPSPSLSRSRCVTCYACGLVPSHGSRSGRGVGVPVAATLDLRVSAGFFVGFGRVGRWDFA